MIDHRKPLAGEGRPIPTEDGSLAVTIAPEVQAVRRDAVITDGKVSYFAGFRRRRQRDGQPFSLVGKWQWRSLRTYCGNPHTLPALGGGEIQPKAGNAGPHKT